MSDRCAVCGTYLQPNAVVCDVCHAPVGGIGPGGGVDLSDPLFGGSTDGPDLQLDVVRPPAPKARPQAAPRVVSAAPSPAAPPSAEPAPKAPREAESTAHAPPPAEVARVAAFAQSPPNVLGVVPYAISVWIRRRELDGELRDAELLTAAATRAAEMSLRELGRQLLEVDPARISGLEAALAAARSAFEIAEGSVASNARAEEVFSDARRSIREQIDRMRSEVDPLRDREAQLATELAAKDTDVGRVRARLQRIDIELRNLATGSDPRRESIQAERVAKEGELSRAEAAAEPIRAELNELRRRMGAKHADIASLERELEQGEDALRRERQRQASDRDAAGQRCDAALRSLGEAARAHGLDSTVESGIATDAEQKVQVLKERKRVEAVYRAAGVAYDRVQYLRGASVLGGAAAVIALMIVAALVT